MMKLLLILCAVGIAGAETLAVQHLIVDKQKVTVAFDLVNVSPRPIRAWTMAVETTKKPPGADPFPARLTANSDFCPAGLQPGQSCHWSDDVRFGDPDYALLGAEVHVNAVLFEDGAVEGDAAQIESESQQRAARLRAAQYWQQRFREIRRGGSPADQLSAFAKLLSAPDASVPDDIRYNGALLPEQKQLAYQVTSQMQSPDAGARFVEGMLDSDVKAAQQLAALFPRRDKPYAILGPVPSPKIVNLTSGFHVIKVEQREGQTHILLRNDYDRDIVEYSLRQRSPDGNGGSSRTTAASDPRHAIPPGGVADVVSGMSADSGPPVEIACVVFRDGSADGDPEMIEQRKDDRAGVQAEAARLLPALREIVQLSDTDMPAAIDKLITDLQTQAAPHPDAFHSIYFSMGVRQKRQQLSTQLRELRREGNSTVIRATITNLIRQYEH